MNPAEGGHKILATAQQRAPTLGRKSVPAIQDAEKWGQERHSDPVVERETLCPVQIWADIITRMDLYPGSSDDTPVNKVWVEKYKTTITSQITTMSLRSGTLSFGE